MMENFLPYAGWTLLYSLIFLVVAFMAIWIYRTIVLKKRVDRLMALLKHNPHLAYGITDVERELKLSRKASKYLVMHLPRRLQGKSWIYSTLIDANGKRVEYP